MDKSGKESVIGSVSVSVILSIHFPFPTFENDLVMVPVEVKRVVNSYTHSCSFHA